MKDDDEQIEHVLNDYLDSRNKVFDFILSNGWSTLQAIGVLTISLQILLKISDEKKIGNEVREMVISNLKDSD